MPEFRHSSSSLLLYLIISSKSIHPMHTVTRLIHRIPSLLLIAAAMAVTSCIREHPAEWHRDDAIYVAPTLEVFPESIILEGREHNAISSSYITNFWVDPDSVADSTRINLTSSSRMADALWRREIAMRPLPSPSTEEIYFSQALLAPEESMETLRAYAPGGVIQNHLYPEVAVHSAWTAAAWEVYCATGSRQWLREAYTIARRSLLSTRQVLAVHDSPLLYGSPAYLFQFTPGTPNYPSWMSIAEIFQSTALGTNVWHYATLSTLSLMATTLGDPDATRWSTAANEVRTAINDTFWVPELSWYGRYTSGACYPILSTPADNFANPLCAILGIATGEMARRMVISRPSLPLGFTPIYPLPAGTQPQFQPMVQSLQFIAACAVADESQMLRALGPLWASSLSEDHTPQWVPAVMRGILGITLTPEAMEFSPSVPAFLREGFTLSNIPWREAHLDVNVQGCGNRIISFTLDSISCRTPSLPSTLTGRHRVDITLGGNRKPEPYYHSESTALPVAPHSPRVQWSSSSPKVNILNFEDNLVYDLYLNGVLTACATRPSLDIATQPDDSAVTQSVIIARDGASQSFPTRPHISAPADAIITIPSTAITPRRPPVHLIRDQATADRYIELAARHNTRLTFYVNSPADATYFLSIGYSNGAESTALRTVEVNGRGAGMLVCPPVARNNWVTTGTSTLLPVKLHGGVNKVSLTYAGTTILLHHITLLRK